MKLVLRTLVPTLVFLVAASAVAAASPAAASGAQESAAGAAGDPSGSSAEIGVTTGMGVNNASQRLDETDSSSGTTLSLGAYLLAHRGIWIYGANADLSSGIFAANHEHVGGVVGLSSPGQRVRLELLGEGGVHFISDIGDELFTRSDATTVALPYVGGQVRLNMDPGAPGHVRVVLAVAGRTDLSRTQRDVMVTDCFFDCNTESQTWRLGGQSLDATLGISYQF